MQSILLTDSRYHILYLLGLLNSTLMSWCFLAVQSVGRRDDFPKIVLKQTRELPFCPIDFSDSNDNSHHDRMVSLVEQILALQRQIQKAKTDHHLTAIQRRIETTDRQIDQLVYKLYGLTKAEIQIVEEAT